MTQIFDAINQNTKTSNKEGFDNQDNMIRRVVGDILNSMRWQLTVTSDFNHFT